jgi:hypothetical protein
MDVLFGFHQGDGLRLHPIDAGVDRIGGFRGRIVFDLVCPKKLAKVGADGAGRIGHEEHGAAF